MPRRPRVSKRRRTRLEQWRISFLGLGDIPHTARNAEHGSVNPKQFLAKRRIDLRMAFKPEINCSSQLCARRQRWRGAGAWRRDVARDRSSWSRLCGATSPLTGRCARMSAQSAPPCEAHPAEARLPAGPAKLGDPDRAGEGGGLVRKLGNVMPRSALPSRGPIPRHFFREERGGPWLGATWN